MPADGQIAPPWPNWWDPEQYGYLLDVDRSGWAWEWLRRNPDYAEEREDCAVPSRLTVRSERHAATLLVNQAALKWGLSFRRVRILSGEDSAYSLGCEGRCVRAGGRRAPRPG